MQPLLTGVGLYDLYQAFIRSRRQVEQPLKSELQRQ